MGKGSIMKIRLAVRETFRSARAISFTIKIENTISILIVLLKSYLLGLKLLRPSFDKLFEMFPAIAPIRSEYSNGNISICIRE